MMTASIRRWPSVAGAGVQVAAGKVFVGALAAACLVCLITASPAHSVPVFREGFESGTAEHSRYKRHFSFTESHLQMSDNQDYVNHTHLHRQTIPIPRTGLLPRRESLHDAHGAGSAR
jgi:hypothetical protein